jgi:hypothetical protein
MPKSLKDQDLTTHDPVEPTIHLVRGCRVILDSDLANIYSVTTKRLNEQVKRNRNRFPEDFMFRLTASEVKNLQQDRSQIATGSLKHRDLRYRPLVFTEHGAIMAASVLKSDRAIAMSLYVVRAFVRMREVLVETKELHAKLVELERKLTSRQDLQEKAILGLFAQIRKLIAPSSSQPTRAKQIGFRKTQKQ